MDTSRSRLEAFETCGAKAFVYAATVGPEDYLIRGSHCHDRFCQPCASARSWAIRDKLHRITADKPLLFITLTLLNRRDEKLRDQLDRLMSCFRQLRRCKLWEDAVAGGAAVYEIKRTKKDCWHTHLHILAEGTWLDADQLSRLWRGISGDSWKVDVQRVRDVAGSIEEVGKYASKPMEAGFWRVANLLSECILALRGRRLITQFGTWYNAGVDLDQEEELFDEAPQRWRMIGSLSVLARHAAGGDAAAARVVHALRLRDPLDGIRPNSTPPPLAVDGSESFLTRRSILNSHLFELMNAAPV